MPLVMENQCSFTVVVALLLLSTTATKSFCRSFLNSTTDQYALTTFRNSITSDPYNVLYKNWSSNSPTLFCSWIGVSCSTKHHQRVTALNLSGFGLVGTLPPSLGNLTFLRSLDISYNNFTGFLPSELSKLRRLEEINVGVNSLTGEIPPWFGALSNLQHIHLNNNTFSGKIPPSLFNISRLQNLDIGSNNLNGDIPVQIGNFSNLEIVNLQDNKLIGSIPHGIFTMLSLVEINLQSNNLSDRLPSDICSYTPKLKRIYFSHNQLEGEIPRSIYKCRELEELVLHDNRFNGNIPSEIANLTMLRILSLASNEFEGNIPKQFANLTSLIRLYLYSNSLTGELPQELGNLQHLEIFTVRHNYLSSSIPSSIFNNLSSMKAMDLSFNQFSGTLPSKISLFNLEELYVYSTGLSGEIPSSITNASKLTRVGLSNNSFSGSIPNFGDLRLLIALRIWGNNLIGAESPTHELTFLSSLTNCQDLEVLEISQNPLNGMLPIGIGNLSASLRIFWAGRCSINGVIPSEIGNLTNLLSLTLSENHFTGFIPTTIGKLNNLQVLGLDFNRLQGYISREFCQLGHLGELYLASNMLTGLIPECMGELKSLRYIDLGSNKLNSTIPSTFWSLRDLFDLDMSSNNFSGQLSSQIAQLTLVNQLDLSSNQFSGDIPSSIDGCQSLIFLSLSNNKFDGSIPRSVGNIRGLAILDLSNNNLSGLIPKSLEDLPFLEYFNVSYNKLEGEIPTKGPFVNFTAWSFVQNSALCGVQVRPCVEDLRKSRPKNVVLVMKYVVPPIVSVIILVIVILILIRRRKKIQSPAPTEISLGNTCKRVSYIELVRGTSGFSETNLLGKGSFGSVFQGTLSDGLSVAVKVFNLQLEGAARSFDTESEILSTIRHRNLVRVIGCCTNLEFRALILAYMPNGCLDTWLYSENHILDLMQRLQIAIDVALALEYLHHGHTFPVVHCDVKPSNVLLGEDMTAHVGDFGVSKLFDEGQTMTQTKTLATIGYAAPEYGSEGKVSTNGDVYSYGILLLELFTGKKPTDDIFKGEMCLKEWVSGALHENDARRVVAADLLGKEKHFSTSEHQCVSSVFGLAMKCLKFLPEDRINMIEAAATLRKIKATLVGGITS